MLSPKIIGRISIYRRVLSTQDNQEKTHVHSHELASLAMVSPAQVRRDLMTIGHSGSPSKGYKISDLIENLSVILDSIDEQKVALVGIGNLGRAILTYFYGKHFNVSIAAAFDNDPQKANRVIHGCMCYPFDRFHEVVKQLGIRTGIIAIPASGAQAVADAMVQAGIRGILNWSSSPLRTPEYVFVENVDVSQALEKVAFFSRQSSI